MGENESGEVLGMGMTVEVFQSEGRTPHLVEREELKIIESGTEFREHFN